MTTQFLILTLDLAVAKDDWVTTIESALRRHGEPLRWAITAVTDQQATVEAVVTVDGP